MGSLSQFIVEDSVKEKLDDAFTKAKSAGTWIEYLDDCHFFLVKAKSENAKLSFQGAGELVQFYYSDVISISDDDDVIHKGINLLNQMLDMCREIYKRECPDWHQQLVGSSLLSRCFLPAIKHSNKDVVYFGMKEILQLIESSVCKDVMKMDGIVPAIIEVISDHATRATPVAKNALIKLCQTEEGLHSVFANRHSLDAMTKVAARSDTAKFIIYEVVQQSCMLGSSQLSMISNSGWLDALVEEASCGDTLSNMVALQLLSGLMENDGALQHLTAAGVLAKLNTSLQLAHSQPGSLAAIHIPDLLKAFGRVGSNRPEFLCEEYSGVVTIMLECCTRPAADSSLAVIAFETLTQVAFTFPGKKRLHYDYNSELKACLVGVGEKMVNGMMAERVRYLGAIINMLDTQQMPNDRIELDELSELMQCWYSFLFPCGSIAPLNKMIRLPFPEIHLQAYELLTVLTKYNWGFKLIAAHNGLLEYLLDRSAGQDKRSKEAKYGVVSALVQQMEQLQEIAGERIIHKLCTYRRKGAYYVEPYIETGLAQMLTLQQT
uniref:26S proteasome non-ATPase regulatory subunit 5 n=2 Tax=Hirondellea gigas TaxID=1518452 RepID=A0A2P2HWT9_9CRUS